MDKFIKSLKLISRAIKLRRAKKQVIKNATLQGASYFYGVQSSIILQDGSVKEDVILGDKITIWGQLISQNHGKIVLGDYVHIASTAKILCTNKVIIGKYTAIADATIICDNNNHPVNPEYRKAHRQTPHGSEMRKWKYSENEPIIIGENVWIGRDVRVNKGVTIGDNSIIAANSVVTKDVPANCIAAGNPAKIVKTDIDKVSLTPLAEKILTDFYEQKEGFETI